MAATAFARAAYPLATQAPAPQRRLPVDGAAASGARAPSKTGNNLNQIARYLNTGGGAETVLPDLREALDDLARIRSLYL